MDDFKLNEQIENDTLLVGAFESCDVRLMNDARWLWLILVPRIPEAEEWHELFADQRQDIDREIAFVAGVIKALSKCEKVNIASLGNKVRQLHIHVVARSEGDPNWPNPVWGYGKGSPYSPEASEQIIDALRTELDME